MATSGHARNPRVPATPRRAAVSALAFLAAALLSGCGGLQPPAPVVQGGDASTPAGRGQAAGPAYRTPGGSVVVRPGDSLYAIAKRQNVRLRSLIDVNRIAPPYRIYPGQTLRLPGPQTRAATRPAAPAAAPPAPLPRRSVVSHVVRAGDTVYSVAQVYGVDVGMLARINRLPPPYRLIPGQRLVLPRSAPGGSVAALPAPSSAPAPEPGPAAPPAPAAAAPSAPPVAEPPPPRRSAATSRIVAPSRLPPRSGSGFIWPVNGKVTERFGVRGKGLHNDGINIRARRGAPVRAVENGIVAYAGNELRGFGNLLLIKHADGWISAYAHNDTLLVTPGQKVRRGQVISRVGSTGSVDSPQLHFELRRGNRAVDPLRYLSRQSVDTAG